MSFFSDEIETFLVGEARNHANDRALEMFAGKSEGLQQSLFADLFSGQILGGIFRGDLRIFFGVPGGVIDAIEDAGEAISAAADDAVETVAEIASLNFLRVFAADGGEEVGIDEAPFEKIYVAEELDSAGMKGAERNSGAFEDIAAELALIAEIVNSEDNGNIF